jgi:hypothetical protein
MVFMRIVIKGVELPGRTFCAADGSPLTNVHVGIQIRSDPSDLVSGDAKAARWDIDVIVDEQPDAGFDFRGPAVHGRRGADLHRGRRSGLPCTSSPDVGAVDARSNRPETRRTAQRTVRPSPQIRLTDRRGGPRCARRSSRLPGRSLMPPSKIRRPVDLVAARSSYERQS